MFVTYLFNKQRNERQKKKLFFFLVVLFLLLFCSSFSSQPNVNVDHLNHIARTFFFCTVCFLFLSILLFWSLCILTNKNFSQRFTSLLAVMPVPLLGAIRASCCCCVTSFRLWCKKTKRKKKKIMQIFANAKIYGRQFLRNGTFSLCDQMYGHVMITDFYVPIRNKKVSHTILLVFTHKTSGNG